MVILESKVRAKLMIPRDNMLVWHAQNTKDLTQTPQYTRYTVRTTVRFSSLRWHMPTCALATIARFIATTPSHEPHISMRSLNSRRPESQRSWAGSKVVAIAIL